MLKKIHQKYSKYNSKYNENPNNKIYRYKTHKYLHQLNSLSNNDNQLAGSNFVEDTNISTKENSPELNIQRENEGESDEGEKKVEEEEDDEEIIKDSISGLSSIKKKLEDLQFEIEEDKKQLEKDRKELENDKQKMKKEIKEKLDVIVNNFSREHTEFKSVLQDLVNNYNNKFNSFQSEIKELEKILTEF